MKKILIHTIWGIAWGCTWFVTLGIIMTACGLSSAFSGSEFIRQAIGAIIVGIAFTLPTIVYQNERLRRGIQVLVHMGIGLTVYFATALYLQWMPVQAGPWAIGTFVVGALLISFIIWLCFSLYYKKQAKAINERIKELQK